MSSLACVLCSVCLHSLLLDHAVGGSVQQLAVNDQAHFTTDIVSVSCSWGQCAAAGGE